MQAADLLRYGRHKAVSSLRSGDPLPYDIGYVNANRYQTSLRAPFVKVALSDRLGLANLLACVYVYSKRDVAISGSTVECFCLFGAFLAAPLVSASGRGYSELEREQVCERGIFMMNLKIQEAFDRQLNAELYSSYLYLSMSAYFESISLRGFANWMRCQAQEELVHAMKFFSFVNERGGTVSLVGVDTPTNTWNSPLHAFEDAYRHEQKVTALINELVDLALQERDHAAIGFLQWFVTEQVEEESSADEAVQQLRLAGDAGGGIFMIDRELATRVFTYPVGPAATN
jgi:ferritin